MSSTRTRRASRPGRKSYGPTRISGHARVQLGDRQTNLTIEKLYLGLQDELRLPQLSKLTSHLPSNSPAAPCNIDDRQHVNGHSDETISSDASDLGISRRRTTRIVHPVETRDINQNLSSQLSPLTGVHQRRLSIGQETIGLFAVIISVFAGRNLSQADLVYFLARCQQDQLFPFVTFVLGLSVYRCVYGSSFLRVTSLTEANTLILDDAYGLVRSISLDVVSDPGLFRKFLEGHYRQSGGIFSQALLADDDFVAGFEIDDQEKAGGPLQWTGGRFKAGDRIFLRLSMDRFTAFCTQCRCLAFGIRKVNIICCPVCRSISVWERRPPQVLSVEPPTQYAPDSCFGTTTSFSCGALASKATVTEEGYPYSDMSAWQDDYHRLGRYAFMTHSGYVGRAMPKKVRLRKFTAIPGVTAYDLFHDHVRRQLEAVGYPHHQISFRIHREHSKIQDMTWSMWTAYHCDTQRSGEHAKYIHDRWANVYNFGMSSREQEVEWRRAHEMHAMECARIVDLRRRGFETPQTTYRHFLSQVCPEVGAGVNNIYTYKHLIEQWYLLSPKIRDLWYKEFDELMTAYAKRAEPISFSKDRLVEHNIKAILNNDDDYLDGVDTLYNSSQICDQD